MTVRVAKARTVVPKPIRSVMNPPTSAAMKLPKRVTPVKKPEIVAAIAVV